LWQGILLQPSEELGPHLISCGEEEEIEKNVFHDCRDFDIELTDENACQQGAHNGPETEGPEFNPTDQKTHSQSDKDSELLVLLKSFHKKVHVFSLL
jgi:hypothetical protein